MQALEWIKVAILADLHFPFHSETALELVCEYLQRERPDRVILNGDIIDCAALSRFSRRGTPYWMNFKGEVEASRPAIEKLLDACGKAKIDYPHGNHEKRHESYIAFKAPELGGLFNLGELYGFDKRVKVIEVKRGNSAIMELTDKLLVAHGERFSSGNSNNVAKLNLMDAGRSIITGHNHSEGSWRDSGGEYGRDMVSLVSGCLCEAPSYKLFHKWTHGFIAGQYCPRTGEFELDHVRISDHGTRLYSSNGSLLAVKTNKGYNVRGE